MFAFTSLDSALSQFFMAFVWMGVIALVIYLAVLFLAIALGNSQANWRLDQIRKDPEAYGKYREWEKETQQQVKEGMQKTKVVAGKVLGDTVRLGGGLLARLLKRK